MYMFLPRSSMRGCGAFGSVTRSTISAFQVNSLALGAKATRSDNHTSIELFDPIEPLLSPARGARVRNRDIPLSARHVSFVHISKCVAVRV